MVELDKCFTYVGDLPKPTSKNSIELGGRVISIIKKDYEGKTTKLYCAYDYLTKKAILCNEDRDRLVLYLLSREDDLKVVFPSVRTTLF